ncbi:MAG: efflux RND transporter periplasmic adaptor subunit [Planctomycetota bacterium]|nr:MAG: efflux RND transporter periplasmic adaptor subunit [Planctomycetota bacterium]
MTNQDNTTKVKSIKKQDNQPAGKLAPLKWLRRVLIIAVVVVIAGAGVFVFLRRASGRLSESNKEATTFTVRRDNLPINVTESGGIKALNSKDIKSEVEGQTTITSIVDEGTIITPNDVNNGKVLVELDSSEIEQKLTQQEIAFLNAEASLTEAKESLDIQKKQNDSDIKAGQMKVRFSLMDVHKYFGKNAAEKLMSASANPGHEHNEIASLIEDPHLGGEALQKLRELEGDIKLKRQELKLANNKLEWTEKLYQKEYVSLNQKEADSLEKETKDIAWEKAKTAKDLFVKYEFPKQAEKLLSDYEEAKRELERVEASARSKLAQAQAKLDSNEATHALQKKRLEKLQKQFEACTIRAPATGQVVYASSLMEGWWRSRNMIEVGAEIRERQKIIFIPDPSVMKIEVKIHETWIDKVQPGQKANITIVAFPDKTFTGEVLKKAPLADPEEWLNPDHKVYATDVRLDGAHDFIKTGMTAKVEINIDELHDVLIVPIQAVVTLEGKKVCYCLSNGGHEKREVETGSFNDDFVEIKSGLAEGQKVLLNPPRPGESEAAS